jgi:electron transfer flavoprotein beta subunit
MDLSTGRIRRDDGDLVIDEIDERALEVALAYRDSHKDTEVLAVTMGAAQASDALRKAMSIGADESLHVMDEKLEGADATLTALVLTAVLSTRNLDLVIAGNASTDGRAGVVPAMVAERLGLPQLSSLDEVLLTPEAVTGVRTVDGGIQRLHAPLPALITVTERTPEVRFPNFKSLLSARKKPVPVLSLADLNVVLPVERSIVLRAEERPPRSAGRIVVDDGRAASELATFLAAERLI